MRDYKKAPAKPKRRPGPKTTGAKPGRAYVTGLVSGIALTLLIQNWEPVRDQLMGPAAVQPETPATEPTETEEVTFEFYTRLPQMEVPVDTRRDQIRDDKEPGKYLYMLQAGSFDKQADAERLKAQLALLGEVAVIQKVTVNGATMHRVRLGPFNSSRKLDAVNHRLIREEIPTMALKIPRSD